MRQEWILQSGSARFLVVRGVDVLFVDDRSRLSAAEASARIPRLVLASGGAGGRDGWKTAASMLRLDGPALLSAERHELSWMLRELERAFGGGRLVALSFHGLMGVRLDPASLVPEPESAASEPAPAPAPPIDEDLTWIEIELLDVRGVPVPHEPFELVLADGERRSGSTDAAGLALVDEIPAGACKVTFPGLDGREWTRA